MKKYIVKENTILFEFLKSNLSNLSKNSIKNLLHNNLVYVNDKCITKYDYLLKLNDRVVIKKSNDIDIIYEDKNIIVINKPCGLLTISTDKEKVKTLYHLVYEYVKKINKNNKIFIVHRLDKDTSGIVMFAKSEKIKNMYQDNWNEIVKERRYYAIINGKMNKKEGTIKSYLKENNNHIVYSVKNKNEGKLAITDYKVLKENHNQSLLDINIKTGRKNQIRVHMRENNTPILGDSKYGIKEKSTKRMYLHAYKLELMDPITKKIIIFETGIPNEFNILYKDLN
ncbi:MAG: RluA family pseudouridine synthase [Bacilli bacterium]|nr:RluA family pseudouridine synthase [Bacilli bacterium]